MLKRFEIWILYLTILLSILFAVGFGILVRQELVGSIKAGWVSKTALTLAEIPVNLKIILWGNDDLTLEDRYDFEFKESNKVISLKMDGDITQKGLSLYKELSHYVLHE